MGERPSPRQEIGRIRRGHITDMALPNGRLRVVYVGHKRPASSVDIPENTNGIFLEHNTPQNGEQFARLLWTRQHSGVIEDASKKKVPIFFGDVRFNPGVKRLADGIRVTKLLAEPFLAIPAIASSSSVKEGLLKAAPILYDSIGKEWAMLLGGTFAKDEDMAVKIARGISQTHPYAYPITLRLRNAVWAAKLNWALENLGDHFTTYVGPLHNGLEKRVRREAQGKQASILKATHKLWGKIGPLEDFYTITRFDPNPKAPGGFSLGEVYEVPELKGLAGVS